jgi:hypothetical protein
MAGDGAEVELADKRFGHGSGKKRNRKESDASSLRHEGDDGDVLVDEVKR